MFDQTFINPAKRSAKPLSFTTSVILQCAAVAVAILFSILNTQSLHTAQLKALLVATRAPVAAQTPRPVETAPTVSPVPKRAFTFSTLLRPIAPRAAQPEPAIPGAPSIEQSGATPTEGIPLGAITPSIAKPVPPAPAFETKPKLQTARISQGVASANLLNKVIPQYPKIAIATRIEGTVLFHAVIDENGRVTELTLLSGHPLLVNAARDAVLQWRYRPTLLNGKPVAVITSIAVTFKLGAGSY